MPQAPRSIAARFIEPARLGLQELSRILPRTVGQIDVSD